MMVDHFQDPIVIDPLDGLGEFVVVDHDDFYVRFLDEIALGEEAHHLPVIVHDRHRPARRLGDSPASRS